MTTNQEARDLKNEENKLLANPALRIRRIFTLSKHLKGNNKKKEEQLLALEKAIKELHVDMTVKEFLELLQLQFDDEETLQMILKLANREEFHELQNLGRYREKLADILEHIEGLERDPETYVKKTGINERLAKHHMENALDINKKGFQKDFNRLTEQFNGLRQLTNEFKETTDKERRESLKLFKNHENIQEEGILPFMVIYLNIRRDSKKALKETKRVNNLEDHLKNLTRKLNEYGARKDKRTFGALHQAVREASKDLATLSEDLKAEIKALARIEAFAGQLAFRNMHELEKLRSLYEKLQQGKFPPEELTKIRDAMIRINNNIDNIHRQERQATIALNRQAS